MWRGSLTGLGQATDKEVFFPVEDRDVSEGGESSNQDDGTIHLL